MCHQEFELYVREAIAERRQLSLKTRLSDTGPKDLLEALMGGASAESDEEDNDEEFEEEGYEKARSTLSNEELLGSMHLFLLSGHGEFGLQAAFAFKSC